MSKTIIQVRRGYSVGYTGSAIGPLGNPSVNNTWSNSTVLAPGEIGFEVNTGKFKIGTDGTTTWGSLPYAGGSAITATSGICSSYDSATNSYTLVSPINISGVGIAINYVSCGVGSGSISQLSLNNRLQDFSNLNTSGIVVSTSATGVTVRGLDEGSNINITNASGLTANPIISLNNSLTGLSYISGGYVKVTGVGNALIVDNDAYIGGTLSAVQINLNGITSSGDVGISGNLNLAGSGSFGSGVYVNGVPVSLSGHSHTWDDVTNFCDGVAECVDTALTVSTGLRVDYNSNVLQVALSGQAATLHTFTGSGLLARTSGPDNNGAFAARSIASGSNIDISNGNGINGNPTISLATTITGLGSLESTTVYTNTIQPKIGETTLNINASTVQITGNLSVRDLTVTGITTTVNSTTITVQDPVITVGGTGTITASDTLDRGLLLRYWGGSAIATGFMGWNYNSNEFIFLSSTTGTINGNDYGAGTFGRIKVGELISNGPISGSNIYVTGATANRVAVFDSNKQIVSTGTPTLTELAYLSGVTGNLQTQLDGRALTSRTITGGSGLVNAGNQTDLTANITLNIGQGYGIKVGTDDIAVDTGSVVVTTGSQLISGIKSFFNNTIFQSGVDVSGTLTANLFSGNGSSITGISAHNITGINNLSSGVLPSLSSPYSNNIIGGSATNLFISSLTVDRAGRVLGATTGVHVNATDSVKGIASFSSTEFTVNTGAVSLNTVPITKLSSSGITIGTTVINLGQTVSGLVGLTGVSAGRFVGSGNLLTDVTAYNLRVTGLNISSTINSIVMITGNGTGIRDTFIDTNLGYDANNDRLVLSNITGNLTTSFAGNNLSVFGSTSISGLSSTTYLLNFIVDGGTP